MSQRKRNLRLFIGVGLFALAAGWLAFTLLGDQSAEPSHDATSILDELPAPSSLPASEPAEHERRAAVISRRAAGPSAPSAGENTQSEEAEQVAPAAPDPPSTEHPTSDPSAANRHVVTPPLRVDPPQPAEPSETATPDAGEAPVDDDLSRYDRQREYIRATFNNLRGPVRHCYEEMLQDIPDATDRLVVVIDFVADETDQAIAEGQLIAIESGDWQVDDLSCFAEAFEGISIPLVEGTEGGQRTTVRYPFQFTASP